jgi:hypothetical protein
MNQRVRTGLLAAAACLSVVAGQATAQAPQQAAGLSVVELFQSQGCSSCPPAIANVNAVAGKPDVLALMFAVDYWDKLGWKDTFARHAYTQRQWDYARGLHHADVATPQVVVNGRKDLVGGDAKELAAAIAATPKPRVPITLTAASVSVGDGIAPIAPADVWLVRYDPRVINVAIKAGENNGKTLAHRDVVREMIRLGRWTGKAASYPVPAGGDPAWKVAVLVQPPGGPILAAAG